MDLNQIRYFLALAETLNFTEAARRSGISQPSLTKSMYRLEDELGAPLIYRNGKDTRLTALGRDVQVEFMRIQASVDGVGVLVQDSVLGRRARLAVGIASTIGPHAFAGFWDHALAQMPSLELYFHPMLPGESESEVLSGKYDLCLLTNMPKPNFKLIVQPLFDEALRLALGASHPLAARDEVTQEEMAEQTYIDRLYCEFRTQLIDHLMDRNVVMHPRIQSEREDWVQQLVARGVGVCALPERSAIVDGLVLKRVHGLDLSRKVSMVAISGAGNPKEVRQILMLAQAYDWSVD